MGFSKGNKLGVANGERKGIRRKMFVEVSEQIIALSPQYNELLQKQVDGEILNEHQREGMDRFERMFEFARPKLARIERKDELTLNLTVDPLLYATLSSRISKVPTIPERVSEERPSELWSDNGQVLDTLVVPHQDSGSVDDGGERTNQTVDDKNAPTPRQEPSSI